jgi:hypothetical protein
MVPPSGSRLFDLESRGLERICSEELKRTYTEAAERLYELRCTFLKMRRMRLTGYGEVWAPNSFCFDHGIEHTAKKRDARNSSSFSGFLYSDHAQSGHIPPASQ